MSAATQPAIPLDDLPRPGVAIPLARWMALIAVEAENVRLRDRVAELERENAKLLEDLNRLKSQNQQDREAR